MTTKTYTKVPKLIQTRINSLLEGGGKPLSKLIELTWPDPIEHKSSMQTLKRYAGLGTSRFGNKATIQSTERRDELRIAVNKAFAMLKRPIYTADQIEGLSVSNYREWRRDPESVKTCGEWHTQAAVVTNLRAKETTRATFEQAAKDLEQGIREGRALKPTKTVADMTKRMTVRMGGSNEPAVRVLAEQVDRLTAIVIDSNEKITWLVSEMGWTGNNQATA